MFHHWSSAFIYLAGLNLGNLITLWKHMQFVIKLHYRNITVITDLKDPNCTECHWVDSEKKQRLSTGQWWEDINPQSESNAAKSVFSSFIVKMKLWSPEKYWETRCRVPDLNLGFCVRTGARAPGLTLACDFLSTRKRRKSLA